MDQTDILTTLCEQALDDGAKPLTLRAIVEEASEVGAQRALTRLGLSDALAHQDISDLRHLLVSWRDVQTTARRTAVRWFTTLLLSLIALGVAFYSDISSFKP